MFPPDLSAVRAHLALVPEHTCSAACPLKARGAQQVPGAPSGRQGKGAAPSSGLLLCVVWVQLELAPCRQRGETGSSAAADSHVLGWSHSLLLCDLYFVTCSLTACDALAADGVVTLRMNCLGAFGPAPGLFPTQSRKDGIFR